MRSAECGIGRRGRHLAAPDSRDSAFRTPHSALQLVDPVVVEILAEERAEVNGGAGLPVGQEVARGDDAEAVVAVELLEGGPEGLVAHRLADAGVERLALAVDGAGGRRL